MDHKVRIEQKANPSITSKYYTIYTYYLFKRGLEQANWDLYSLQPNNSLECFIVNESIR